MLCLCVWGEAPQRCGPGTPLPRHSCLPRSISPEMWVRTVRIIWVRWTECPVWWKKSAAKCENLSYLRGLYSGSRYVRAAANLQKSEYKNPYCGTCPLSLQEPLLRFISKHLANKYLAKHLTKCQLGFVTNYTLARRPFQVRSHTSIHDSSSCECSH